MELTPMQQTFNNVYWGSQIIMFITGIIVAVVVGFIASAMSGSRSGCATGLGVALLVFFAHAILGHSNAETKALAAITDRWEAAKNEKATFLEVLHAPFVAAGEEIHYCKRTVDNRAGVNCQYYNTEEINHRRVCTEDADGEGETCHIESDTQYTPLFKYERSPWAMIGILPRFAEQPLVMIDGEPHPRLYFAHHLAPEDWENNKYSWSSVEWGDTFDSRTPEEWRRIKTGLASGKVVVGSVYHHYLNFFHALDNDLFELYDGHIPTYKEQNLLPMMQNIYSKTGESVGYDYDFVQFLGGLKPQDSAIWQELASTWAGIDAGPKLQASLMLFFAPANQVTNRTQWINTSKAWLMSKKQFNRRILPKNLLLIGCAVDGTTVKWCEMETGMYEGNHLVRQAVSRVRDIPFTPSAFFGEQSAGYEPETNGIRPATLKRGKGVLELMYAPQPDGFKRVSMGPNDWMRTNIQVDPEQRAKIERDATGGTLLFAMAEIFIMFAVIVGLWWSSQNR